MRLVEHQPRIGGPGLTRPQGPPFSSPHPSEDTHGSPAPAPAEEASEEPGTGRAPVVVGECPVGDGTPGAEVELAATAAAGGGAGGAVAGGVGVTATAAAGQDWWLSEEEAGLVQRFDPVALDSIGFFVAKFTKLSSMLPEGAAGAPGAEAEASAAWGR